MEPLWRNLEGLNILVCDENLEGRDKVSEGNALVSLPLLVDLGVIDKDDEVISVALEVDLVLCRLSAGHCERLVV